MRILLVEDDPSIAASITLTLQKAEMNVCETDSGREGYDSARFNEYDLVILDLSLPDMDGFDVLRNMRVAKLDTPVLILSETDWIEDRLKAFSFGADDYLAKPFHREELVARIRAIVRRANGHSQSIIRTGRVWVNLETKTVSVDGRRVRLTSKEYQLLELLSLRKGTVQSKAALMGYLYGGMDEPGSKIIDVFVCKIRRKLAALTGGGSYIETVWGRGYLLRDPESASRVSEDENACAPLPPIAGAHQGYRSATHVGKVAA